MTRKVEDLRVRKTKAALANSLFDLLNRGAFDNIKVVDICERAHIHRTTFYKHFEDKYQLLDFVINQILAELMQDMKNISLSTKPEDYYLEVLDRLITYIHRNRLKFRLIVRNNSTGMFMQTMQQLMCEHITSYYKEFEQAGCVFPAPIDMMAQYRSGGLISVAKYLIEQDNYKPEEAYGYLYKISTEPPYRRTK